MNIPYSTLNAFSKFAILSLKTFQNMVIFFTLDLYVIIMLKQGFDIVTPISVVLAMVILFLTPLVIGLISGLFYWLLLKIDS